MNTGLPAPQWVDYLLAAYLLWGTWRGYRRRVGRELQALIKLLLLLAWLWGFGAFSWLRDLFDGAISQVPIPPGMLTSLLGLLAAFYLLYLLRNRLAGAIEARISRTKARASGALAGLLRTAAGSSFLLLLFGQLPWLGDRLRESLSGRLLAALTG